MSTSALSLTDQAYLREDAVRSIIRDWQIYLRARLVYLTPDEPQPDVFERDTNTNRQEEAARDIAMLSQSTRAMFEQAVHERRETRRADLERNERIADPDELDRLTLSELLRESLQPDNGYILVPSRDEAGQIDWLEFRADELETLPDERSYRTAKRGAAQRERLKRIVAGVALIPVILLLVWTIFRSNDTPRSASATGASVNGASVSAWPATRLTLHGDTEPASWPLAPVDTSAWPNEKGAAYVRAGVWLPVTACAPVDSFAAFDEARIAGDGSVPERVYTLGKLADTPAPDLVLTACGDPAIHIAGMLQPAAAPPAAAIGESIPLADHQITLASVTVSGPADTPDVPQGAARITITLVGGDITAFAPVLRLSDGTQQTAPEIRTNSDGSTELRFLVTAPRETLPAELRLSDSAARQAARWIVQIAPPPERLRVLQERLLVADVYSNGDGTLSAVVTNTSDQPLELSPADVTIEYQGLRTPIDALQGSDTALVPGETRTLTLSLSADLQGSPTLWIGAQPYRVRTNRP